MKEGLEARGDTWLVLLGMAETVGWLLGNFNSFIFSKYSPLLFVQLDLWLRQRIWRRFILS